jgi:3-deoxy-D-manno-octulosonic-acid transferase
MLRAIVLLIYNLLLPLGLIAMAPGAWKKMRQRGGKPSDLWQRLGFFNEEQASEIRALQSGDGVLWIHAVSVGEVGIASKLVRELLRQRPGLRFVLTSTTPTGCALAIKLGEELSGAVLPIYSPVDGWTTVRRFLRIIRPVRLVLVEAEVWPNLVFAATQRVIPVTLVNARLSARSERRFRSLRVLVRPIFAMLECVCVQEPEDTARFAITFGLPAAKLACTGSIKFDMSSESDPSAQVTQFRALLTHLGWQSTDPVLLAASTHPGEELEVARVFSTLKKAVPSLRLILVPRHVERSDKIAEELSSHGFTTLRRSRLSLTNHEIQNTQHESILLVDSTGELRAWQHLATMVVIGKSFLATGGQNPAEAVMAGKPVVFGPHMENFEALVRILLAKQGAVQVQDFTELQRSLQRLLQDAPASERLAHAGRDALRAHEGSTRRTAEMLLSASA